MLGFSWSDGLINVPQGESEHQQLLQRRDDKCWCVHWASVPNREQKYNIIFKPKVSNTLQSESLFSQLSIVVEVGEMRTRKYER